METKDLQPQPPKKKGRELSDIIFARTITKMIRDEEMEKGEKGKDKVNNNKGCEVTYSDGATAIVDYGINELFKILSTSKPRRRRYFMVGRSALICENNIVKIHPAKKTLIMAYDSIEKEHKELKYFSDNLLRKLRNDMK